MALVHLVLKVNQEAFRGGPFVWALAPEAMVLVLIHNMLYTLYTMCHVACTIYYITYQDPDSVYMMLGFGVTIRCENQGPHRTLNCLGKTLNQSRKPNTCEKRISQFFI